MNSIKSASSLISKQTQHFLRQKASTAHKIFLRAITYYENGQLAEAEAGYREVLKQAPNHADSLHLLGLILGSKGQSEEGIHLITQAISCYPQFALYYSNRAALYQSLGRHTEAISDFHQSVQMDPSHAGVWAKFGDSLAVLKKFPGALDVYQKALELQPDWYYPHHMIGNIYLAKEAYEEAAAAFQQALCLKPNFPEALTNRAIALTSLKKLDEAMSCYEQALAITPENATTYFNIATLLVELEQYELAEKRYQEALRLNPHFVAAYINLGNLYQDQKRAAEASHCWTKAKNIDPAHPDLIWSEAMRLLQQGDFKEGWEKYEVRLQTLEEHQKRSKFSQPRWKGESFVNKTLLIRAEQGLGDTLQFIRYLPLVKERGGRIIVECQRELLRLFKTCYPGLVDVWIPHGGTPPVFDYYIELLSLPFIFKTTLETIPFSEGYLRPHTHSSLKGKVKNLSHHQKIGFVWAGNPKYKSDKLRSFSLSQYKPILDLTEFTFCSLQWGKKGIEDISREGLNEQLINLSPEFSDFVDTATAVSELDLIITTDTSMVHLAGATGQKTWVLLSASPDFRWLLDRKDTPWYQSVRIFRQPKPGDWDSVIQQVVSELITDVQ